jgi:hypothetical protein
MQVLYRKVPEINRREHIQMKTYEFDAIIIKHDSIDAAFIEFPYDVEKEFGVKGQVKIRATFDGYEYRGSLAKMGHHCHCLGITQKIRKEINKQPGEKVHVVITKDEVPRLVEVPEDFRKQLDEKEKAKNAFNSLSYTNQKEMALWITSAKKIETREMRIEKALEQLLS